MEAEIRLFAIFRDFLPKEAKGSGFIKNINDGVYISDIVNELCLPAHIPRIIIVNGAHAGEGYLIKDGDIVSIFPQIEGG